MESGQNYEGVWETYVPQLGPEAEHRQGVISRQSCQKLTTYFENNLQKQRSTTFSNFNQSTYQQPARHTLISLMFKQIKQHTMLLLAPHYKYSQCQLNNYSRKSSCRRGGLCPKPVDDFRNGGFIVADTRLMDARRTQSRQTVNGRPLEYLQRAKSTPSLPFLSIPLFFSPPFFSHPSTPLPPALHSALLSSL